MRPRLAVLLLAATGVLSACDGGTGSETAGGEYIAALESPAGPEGAAVLEITGEGVQSVHAASLTLFQQPVSGGRRLVLVREPAGRLEFRVRMAPGNGPPSVRVVEVVDGNDQPRASAEGYTVTFTRTRGDE
jgi:hypothetical protein